MLFRTDHLSESVGQNVGSYFIIICSYKGKASVGAAFSDIINVCLEV